MSNTNDEFMGYDSGIVYFMTAFCPELHFIQEKIPAQGRERKHDYMETIKRRRD